MSEYSRILLEKTREEMEKRLQLMKVFVPEEAELIIQMQETLYRIEEALNG